MSTIISLLKQHSVDSLSVWRE